MAARNVFAFIMASEYIIDLCAADKERHVDKVKDSTKKSMETHSIRTKTEVYPSVSTVFVEFVPFIRCWFVG